MKDATYKSPLHKMVCTTRTALWNDSCSIEEFRCSIDHEAVGATANPVIVGQVFRQELDLWRNRVLELIREKPQASEEEIVWMLTEEMSVNAARLLLPIFERERGRNGRLSIQTDPRLNRCPRAIVAQAVHFSGLAPNMIVKIPLTEAGLAASEEATHRGISINATVCFSVAAMKRAYRSIRSEGTACNCSPRSSATICTGPSSSGGTSLSPPIQVAETLQCLRRRSGGAHGEAGRGRDRLGIVAEVRGFPPGLRGGPDDAQRV